MDIPLFGNCGNLSVSDGIKTAYSLGLAEWVAITCLDSIREQAAIRLRMETLGIAYGSRSEFVVCNIHVLLACEELLFFGFDEVWTFSEPTNTICDPIPFTPDCANWLTGSMTKELGTAFVKSSSVAAFADGIGLNYLTFSQELVSELEKLDQISTVDR